MTQRCLYSLVFTVYWLMHISTAGMTTQSTIRQGLELSTEATLIGSIAVAWMKVGVSKLPMSKVEKMSAKYKLRWRWNLSEDAQVNMNNLGPPEINHGLSNGAHFNYNNWKIKLCYSTKTKVINCSLSKGMQILYPKRRCSYVMQLWFLWICSPRERAEECILGLFCGISEEWAFWSHHLYFYFCKLVKP